MYLCERTIGCSASREQRQDFLAKTSGKGVYRGGKTVSFFIKGALRSIGQEEKDLH